MRISHDKKVPFPLKTAKTQTEASLHLKKILVYQLLDTISWIESNHYSAQKWNPIKTLKSRNFSFRKNFSFLLALFITKWKEILLWTLCLLVSSADNFCKLFGPRSGPTNVGPDLDPNYLTLWRYTCKNFSKKLILKKICRRQKRMQNYLACKELIESSYGVSLQS